MRCIAISSTHREAELAEATAIVRELRDIRVDAGLAVGLRVIASVR